MREYIEYYDILIDDIFSFSFKVIKFFWLFWVVVSGMKSSEVEECIIVCLEGYERVFDGLNDIGKFYWYWKKIFIFNVSWNLF